MPGIVFNGPAGRLEGRFQPAEDKQAPIAIVLHPHSKFAGTMNNPLVHHLYYHFARHGFAVLRFNFRGVGRSQGLFDHGQGELSDAATALDWVQANCPSARACWVAGVSFGAWIALQLLMRRPEIEGFIALAPPANLYDFSFLSPCPSSGLIINGSEDRVARPGSILELVKKLRAQKGISIGHKIIEGANHFFSGKEEETLEACSAYLQARLSPPEPPVTVCKQKKLNSICA